MKRNDKEIEEIERKHTVLARNAKECYIYKVHEQLRNVNEKAYEPVLLAIGPYNDQGKVGQGFMEEHKLRYLQQMLKRTKGCLETYITTLKALKEEALKCYDFHGEHISQTSDDQFVEMMVLDGCFIIELFHKFAMMIFGRMEDDPIFQMKWVLPRIARDLLLFENQLPFFVLAKLFEMIIIQLKRLSVYFVSCMKLSPLHLLVCATKLEEAGIKFKKVEKSNSYVYNYVNFMDDLINSPKDVELLRRKGIISNDLGGDEIISTMVNKLGHYISYSSSSFIYARTSTNLNMHCRRRWNVWMEKLRRDYFNSPWALISFLGAVLLLALAITQTIFSIIP
ncbi:hypothetical protein I3843_12G005800 [Carya illinoinensis]|nr:hypothetical protein I3843_12G005800 [Carya illinoinensis]